jgi:ankyrin repeat protein
VNPISEGGEGERLNSLHIAALRGHLEILRLVLDTNRIDVDQYTYYDYPYGFFSKFKHRTAVHIALATGHVECLKLLIDYGGANVKKPVYEAHTTSLTFLIAPFSCRVQLQPTEVSSIDMLSKKFIEYMAKFKVEYDPSSSLHDMSTQQVVVVVIVVIVQRPHQLRVRILSTSSLPTSMITRRRIASRCITLFVIMMHV